MAKLEGYKYELFARKLARGRPPDIAFNEARLAGNSRTAQQLSKDKIILARVAELRPAFPKLPIDTKQQQIDSFEEARVLAMSRFNPSAAITAIIKKLPLLQALAKQEYEDQRRLDAAIIEACLAAIERVPVPDEATSIGLYPDSEEDDGTSLSDDSEVPIPKSVVGAELPSLAARLARLLSELEQARQLAMALGKATAAARAISEQIKMNELTAEQALHEENDLYYKASSIERFRQNLAAERSEGLPSILF